MLADGLYLFVYSEINPIMNVLGHSLRHDHNMAVFQKSDNKITLLAHIEFERFSGIKHHNVAFYDRKEAIEYINKMLNCFELCIDDFVGVYGVPDLSGNDDLFYSSLETDSGFSYHAISHLYSSMLDREKFVGNDVIMLSYDGGPDSLVDENVFHKPLFCGAFSRNGKKSFFPISSPGGYWLYASNRFNLPEGTLMALAYATKAKSLEKFEDLPDYVYSSDRKKCKDAIDNIIEKIMNYREKDRNILYTVEECDGRFTSEELKISMIMKVIQELSVKNVFSQIDYLLEKYEIDPKKTIISLSGGYALNCPTNSIVMKKYHFKDMMCAPCVNDSGLSIGMGLYFFEKFMTDFIYEFNGPFYGYSDVKYFENTVEKYMNYIESISENVDQLAYDIKQAPILWFDERAESGPRALGHRSIIANSMDEKHKDLLNIYKQREWWRPVAPIILEEDFGEWFDGYYSSPFMLHNFSVKEEVEKRIPAVLHLDGTARVQTLKKEDNERLYEVITSFKQMTGVPIVCNTSMNDKGEPIINTLEQAINFALRKHIKVIYSNGYRIEMRNFDQYDQKDYLKRDDKVFVCHKDMKKEILGKLNPYNLPMSDFLICIFNPFLRKLDLSKKEDYEKAKSILKKLKLFGSNLLVFEGWGKIFEEEGD